MRGVSTRHTKLGWRVIRLHYTADEDKRPTTTKGREWYEAAHRGVPEARWRQEYEIDYGALGGQLVFPTFDESIHVIPRKFSRDLDQGEYTVWLGADPHPRTPHAFVFVAVDKAGDKIIPWSYWPERDPNKELITRDYAEYLKVVFESGAGLRPYRMMMDQAGASFNAEEKVDYFKKYREHGIRFTPAQKNKGEIGEQTINEELALYPYVVDDRTEQRPRLTIWDGCGDNAKLILQVKNLRYQEWKGNVMDKDPPEKSEDKERHLVDALIYALLDKPRFIAPRRRGNDDFIVLNEGTGW